MPWQLQYQHQSSLHRHSRLSYLLCPLGNREFGTRIYRVELHNLTAVISENNDPALMLMDCEAKSWSWSCSNDLASLELNKELKSAVLIRFFGGIYQNSNSNQKDSIYLETLDCEGF
ncbi:hypothetical protein N8303_03100 [Gammaproteobacteria bacterium]|nr:hypothetical protein [Gammaproteobacteria bacterium]